MAYTGRHRRRAIWFAVVGNFVPIGIACTTNGGSHRWPFVIGAIVAALAPLGVTVIGRRIPPLLYLAAFAGIPGLTAMQSYTGGVSSGYAVLLMMPMVWFGLQATQRELIVGLWLLIVCCIAPMLVLGAPAYPRHWGQAILLILIAGSVAGSLHSLTSEMQRLAQRLRSEATIDDLTGLLNRRGWREAASAQLAEAERDNSPLGIIAIDLNNFKQLNDSMGHDIGDRVLAETAKRLRVAIRSGDLVARMGGDEFLVMLPAASVDEMLLVVDRLRTLTPQLGAFSAGVAARYPDEDLAELLKRSDTALYEAKSTGRTVAVAASPLPTAAFHA